MLLKCIPIKNCWRKSGLIHLTNKSEEYSCRLVFPADPQIKASEWFQCILSANAYIECDAVNICPDLITNDITEHLMKEEEQTTVKI